MKTILHNTCTPSEKANTEPGSTILIVDDRIENLIAIEAVVRKENYNVIRALSGFEALEKVAQYEVDCILLDVQMPGIDGFEVAQKLKSMEDTRNIPIIFMTALNTDKKYILKGFESGAIEYMNKPLDQDILRAKINTHTQLHRQNKELAQAHDRMQLMNKMLEDQSKEINASIRYAKNIQNTIFPSFEKFKSGFPNSFIFNRPKDIVSGDFYWMSKIDRKVILACVDCTGHGVPGALMTMVASNLLKQAVDEKKIVSPSLILEDIRKGLQSTFNHQNQGARINDGMAIGVCIFDTENKVLEFSGAGSPLLLIKQGVSTVMSPQPFGISNETSPTIEYPNYSINIEQGDCIYLFTDGYADQFGGLDNKRFMKKNLLKTISELSKEDMILQQTIIENVFMEWKGEEDQVDDVLLIGIRF